MKKILATLFVAALALTAQTTVAQSTKSETTATKPAGKDWKEKSEFHTVMAQTFHPMEEGNLEPIKTRSQELFEKAMAWASSTPPAEFNNEKVKQALTTLAHQTRELNSKIKFAEPKATDEEIKVLLTKAHDTFHEIVGLCKPGAHDHGHGHDHSDPNHKH